MTDETRLAGAFLIGLVAAFAVTPVAIAVAERIDFHDRPLGYKGHAAPTPYLGGAAVVVAFLLAALSVGAGLSRLAPIVGLAGLVFAIGTLDDRISLAPGVRMIVEAGAATTLWSAGLGWHAFSSDAANLVLTIIWVLGLVNAFNLMDNMDGAAATVGVVTALATAGLALTQGDPAIAILCGGLAGACAGFLPYNLAGPARIFLGDGGSLPIGFVIAASTMALSTERSGNSLFLATVILAGVPVLDTALVMISRRRSRIPLLTGGRDHVTHRLVTRLRSPRAVALSLGLAQAMLGAIAIGVLQLGQGSVVTAWSLWFVVTAAAITLLETKAWAPVREGSAEMPATELTRNGPRKRFPLGTEGLVVEAALLLFFVAVFGLSPVLFGFYDVSVWGPIALFVLAALLGLIIARPAALRPTAVFALVGLLSLWLWSLVSMTWGESADGALNEANRWLLYAALFAVLILLLRDDALGRRLMGFATVAILGLAAYLAVDLLFGDSRSLFLAGRLNKPLGYVNGQAGYLLLALWPLIAVVERARSRVLGSCSIFAATLIVGLVLLSQTRAAVPAIVLTTVVLIAAIPGRPKRGWAIAVVLAGVAVAAPALIDVYQAGGPGATPPPAATIHRGIEWLLAAALGAALAWAAGSWVADRVGDRLGPRPSRVASVAVLLGLVLPAVGVAVVATGNPVTKVRRQVDAFLHLERKSEPTRLVSGSGNRYDYWRVAVIEFRDHPFRGVGAGNYDETYFRERRTTQDVRQPHSIELQALSETGLVGVLALLLFVGGVLAGFVRRASLARRDPAQATLAVAAGGMFLTWLIHTSVDWLHLMPGITGMALAAAAVLVSPWARTAHRERSRIRWVTTCVAIAVVLFGAIEIGRSALAHRYRSSARSSLASDPLRTLKKANDALALNDEAVPTYYVKAAAYARLNRYQDSRRTLLQAVRKEPHNFVTWALLGDLAGRAGKLREASVAYYFASKLNPRDPALKRFVRHPEAALRR